MLLDIATAAAQAPVVPNANAETKKKGDSSSEELKIDSEQLPKGYIAPPEKLSIFDLELPLATKEEMARLKKEYWTKFSKTKNECDLSPAGQKIVEGAIRYLLAEMTLKENLYELPTLRRRFVDQITQTNNSKRPEEIKAMSQFIGATVVKQIPELLKNQYHVRLQAVEILGELDFAPSYEILLQVLHAEDIRVNEQTGQPEAVKIAAAKSLIRILRFTNPQVKDRNVMALAVAAELEKSDTHWWLQQRYIDALRYCDISGVDAKNNDKPFVVDILLTVIRDSQRDWRVRSRACYALGRVRLPKGAYKDEELVTAVSDCALQLSNAAAAKPNDPDWKNCIWNIYLAFHKGGTVKDPDLDLDRKPAGLLEKNKVVAQRAYDVIVPIVNDIMGGHPPDAGNLRNLSTFVRERQPQAAAAK